MCFLRRWQSVALELLTCFNNCGTILRKRKRKKRNLLFSVTRSFGPRKPALLLLLFLTLPWQLAEWMTRVTPPCRAHDLPQLCVFFSMTVPGQSSKPLGGAVRPWEKAHDISPMISERKKKVPLFFLRMSCFCTMSTENVLVFIHIHAWIWKKSATSLQRE